MWGFLIRYDIHISYEFPQQERSHDDLMNLLPLKSTYHVQAKKEL